MRILNVATEPLRTREIARRFFPEVGLVESAAQPGRYDFLSLHAGHWGGRDGYLYNRGQVLEDLGLWLQRWRGADEAGRRELSPSPEA
jgi:hypothetical protein